MYRVKQKSLWVLIEQWGKIIAAVVPIAIFMGAWIIYHVLERLESQSLFVEVVSTPSVLISFVIIFSIGLLASFGVPFFFPHLICQQITDSLDYKNKWVLVIFLLCNVLFVAAFDSLLKSLVESFLVTWVLASIIPILFLLKHAYKHSKLIEIFPLLMYQSALLVMSALVYFLITNFPLVDEESSGWASTIYAWLVGIFYVLNWLTAIELIPQNKKKHLVNKNLRRIIPLSFIGFLSFLFMVIPEMRMPRNVLHMIRYIEFPSDSDWYLLDNRFLVQNRLISGEAAAGSQETILPLSWKKRFSPVEKGSYAMHRYENAIYGYMAWNLGRNKIFCPQDTNIYAPNVKKGDVAKCLLIKDEFLQSLPQGLWK